MTAEDTVLVQKFDLSKVLDEVCLALPNLLRSDTTWQSLNIDYAKPYLHRLFTDYTASDGRQVRINLHRFLPYEFDPNNTAGALLHPHPWTSAIRIVHVPKNWCYLHEVGYEQEDGSAPEINNLRPDYRNAGDSFAMAHPKLWHRVINRCTDGCIYTVMVTWKSADWHQPAAPIPDKPLSGMSKYEIKTMMDEFRAFFPLV